MLNTNVIHLDWSRKRTTREMNTMFSLHGAVYDALKKLRCKDNLILIQADWGFWVAILDKTTHKDKMLVIINDSSESNPDDKPENTTDFEKK